jgi:hypothetical protein
VHYRIVNMPKIRGVQLDPEEGQSLSKPVEEHAAAVSWEPQQPDEGK